MHSVMMSSKYPKECEKKLNEIINVTQSATITYDSLAAQCNTHDLRMTGFHTFFQLCARRHRAIGQNLIDWQTTRGGKYTLTDIRPLTTITQLKDTRDEIKWIVEMAVNVERMLEEKLTEMCVLSRERGDLATEHHITHYHLHPQVYVHRMMLDHMHRVSGCGDVYTYDRCTMMALVEKVKRTLRKRMSKKIRDDDDGDFASVDDEIIEMTITCATMKL
uniref:Ferritin n=1 Tax=Trichobilharzia regenti TaxID=157069 RepID=A0AA85KC47_TRIRE|nr:unnamed protein product [Trichobilharzia regenti]